MQFTEQDYTLRKMYGLNWGETEAIRQYWRIFYDNPKKYKTLEAMVLHWLKNGEGEEIAEKWNEEVYE